jgi:hypothetical protein
MVSSVCGLPTLMSFLPGCSFCWKEFSVHFKIRNEHPKINFTKVNLMFSVFSHCPPACMLGCLGSAVHSVSSREFVPSQSSRGGRKGGSRLRR